MTSSPHTHGIQSIAAVVVAFTMIAFIMRAMMVNVVAMLILALNGAASSQSIGGKPHIALFPLFALLALLALRYGECECFEQTSNQSIKPEMKRNKMIRMIVL